MPTIPTWLTGPGGGYVVSVTPQTVSSAGALTDGTVATLTGSADKVNVSYKAVTEEISSMTAGRSNNVKLQAATTVVITEILKSNGTNILAGLAQTADYFKCIVTRGPQTWTFYGLLTSYDEDLARGKSTGTATFEMVDPATANPSYV